MCGLFTITLVLSTVVFFYTADSATTAVSVEPVSHETFQSIMYLVLFEQPQLSITASEIAAVQTPAKTKPETRQTPPAPRKPTSNSQQTQNKTEKIDNGNFDQNTRRKQPQRSMPLRKLPVHSVLIGIFC